MLQMRRASGCLSSGPEKPVGKILESRRLDPDTLQRVLQATSLSSPRGPEAGWQDTDGKAAWTSLVKLQSWAVGNRSVDEGIFQDSPIPCKESLPPVGESTAGTTGGRLAFVLGASG